MQFNLASHSSELIALINDLPTENNYKSSSELHTILIKYLKILDQVNGSSEAYKSATRVYYADITNIRDNIQQLLVADTHDDKNLAFEKAKKELQADLRALARLIKQQEEPAV